MRYLLLLLVACNGSSGTDGGTMPDGTAPMDGSSGDDTGTMQDSAMMQDTGTGPQTCVIPKGGAMCGGVNWACDETNDCSPGMACCLTLETKAQKVDPKPEPPSKFLEPTEAARLASEVKRRSQPASGRNDERGEERKSSKGKKRLEAGTSPGF